MGLRGLPEIVANPGSNLLHDSAICRRIYGELRTRGLAMPPAATPRMLPPTQGEDHVSMVPMQLPSFTALWTPGAYPLMN